MAFPLLDAVDEPLACAAAELADAEADEALARREEALLAAAEVTDAIAEETDEAIEAPPDARLLITVSESARSAIEEITRPPRLAQVPLGFLRSHCPP
jgi:hypothetical protein